MGLQINKVGFGELKNRLWTLKMGLQTLKISIWNEKKKS